MEICNKSATAVVVTITTPATLTFNGVLTEFTPVPASFNIAPGGCQTVILNLNLQDNSQNSSITGTIYWTATGGGLSVQGSTPISTAATPPCVDCAPPTSAAQKQSEVTTSSTTVATETTTVATETTTTIGNKKAAAETTTTTVAPVTTTTTTTEKK